MGGVDDELGDEVFFPRAHAQPAGATAPLLAVDGDWSALQITGMGNSDGDLFVGDQVFQLQLGGLVEDLGAALVAELLARCFELLDDHGAQLRFRGQNGFVLGDALAHFDQLLENFVGGKLGQAIELQLEDGIGLLGVEAISGRLLRAIVTSDFLPPTLTSMVLPPK